MKMRIISDDLIYEESMRVALARALRQEPEFENLILVDVNAVQDSSQKRDDRIGIKIATELAKETKNIIILTSFEYEYQLMNTSEDFAGLMTLPNVGFVDIVKLEKLPAKYQELASGKKKTDTTGLAVFEFNQKAKKMSHLKHDLGHITRDLESRDKWFAEALTIGLTGTAEEIIAAVETWRPETAGEFNGVSLEGIFVDAFETLFNENWELFHGVKQAVEDIAAGKETKIFVISDSDTNMVKNKLAENGITWPLLSKYDIRGATLECVIDNLKQEEFESTYNIKATAFIRAVPELWPH